MRFEASADILSSNIGIIGEAPNRHGPVPPFTCERTIIRKTARGEVACRPDGGPASWLRSRWAVGGPECPRRTSYLALPVSLRTTTTMETFRSSKLITNTLIYGLASSIGAVFPLILVPVLTRYLTPEAYGKWAMFQIAIAALAPIVVLGVQSSIRRQYVDRQQCDFGKYVGTSMLIVFMSGIIVSLVLALAHPWLTAAVGLDSKWMFVAVLSCVFAMPASILASIWQMEMRAVAYSVLQLVQPAFRTILTIVLVVVLAMNWQGAAISLAATACVMLPFAMCLIYRQYQLKLRFDAGYAHHILSFSVPLVFYALSNVVVRAADRVLIIAMIGLSGAGIYTSSLQIASILVIASQAFMLTWEPYLYSKLKSNDEYSLKQIVRSWYAYVLVLAIGATVIMLSADVVAATVLGEAFLSAREFLPWLCCAFVFQGIYVSLTLFIKYRRANRVIGYTAVCVAILNIALSAWLLRVHGIVGAAQATLCVYITASVILMCVVVRMYKLPWFRIL